MMVHQKGGAREGAGAPEGNQNAKKRVRRERQSVTLAPGTKVKLERIARQHNLPNWTYAIDWLAEREVTDVAL